MNEIHTDGQPRILVVDDSRVIRIAAKKILKDEFAVSEASHGEEAWEQLNDDNDICLIVSDLSMPYLDGMGLLARLREAADNRLANMPVIIVTGAEDDEDAKSRAFAAGASDFLTKPFDSVQLLAHIRSHIKLTETENRLAQTETAIATEPTKDKLTGLSNQKNFAERGRQELAYAIRHRNELSAIFINIDGFDQVFIRYGKPAGEAILKGVADIVAENVRREDSAGRVGLARFGLILPSANSIGARQLAVRICQQIAGRIFAAAGKRFKITASAGVVSPEIKRDSRFEDILADGQRFLERATQAGGNRVVFDQQPAASQKSAAEPVVQTPPPPPPKPDIAKALALIRTDEAEPIKKYLDELVKETLPLLELWQQEDNAEAASAIAQIKTLLEN